MSKVDGHRDFYSELQVRGLLDYGSVISHNVVRALLGLEYPELATKAVFDKLSLAELAAIDYVRNILISQGKYIMGTQHGYRVLLPSENKGVIEQYLTSAIKKEERALKLSRSTPQGEPSAMPDQTEARVLMRRKGMRK